MTATAPAKILIVDDEVNFCASLKILLEAAGYDVTVANTGKEAACLFDNKYDAVLLDIELPDTLGTELAALLHQKHPETATIILSGNATVDSAIKALREGVYDFLRKPSNPDEIIHAIKRAIEHKQLETRLLESENRFRQLAEATWEGIIIYESGLLLEANRQLCDIFGYQEEELLGKQIFDILLQRESIRTLDMENEKDVIGLFEAQGTRKDGSSFPVEIRVKKIEHQGRTVQVAAIRNISVRKDMEEKRISLENRLNDARRMESLGLMAGGVAHDLNNILSGVITYPDLLLLDMGKDHKYRDEITLIRDAGKMAAAVVSDLLTVARGQNCIKNRQNINVIASTYLNSIECRDLHSRYPSLQIITELEDEVGDIECSSVHISKTLMNLVVNGAEAMEGKGTITVSSKNIFLTEALHGYEVIEPGRYTVLSVQDTGPGISKEDQRHIFEPFYSKKTMGRSGTGLGLAMVWNTMRDHNGYIGLQTSNAGTCFALYFPSFAKQLIAQKPGGFKEIKQGAVLGKGERILVVDDQASQREIAKRLLSRLGYSPFLVKSGEEALDFLKNNNVDLIMLDMIMEPGLNGCETYEKIKASWPSQKAIIISGYSSLNQINRAKDLGISSFVKKPYSIEELSQVIKLEISN